MLKKLPEVQVLRVGQVYQALPSLLLLQELHRNRSILSLRGDHEDPQDRPDRVDQVRPKKARKIFTTCILKIIHFGSILTAF